MQTKANLQDLFLLRARRDKLPVTMFLMNGFQMRGTIAGFDAFVVIGGLAFHQQAILQETREKYKGGYILAVEGNPPLNEDGMYCFPGGEPFVEKLKRVSADAKALIENGLLRLNRRRENQLGSLIANRMNEFFSTCRTLRNGVEPGLKVGFDGVRRTKPQRLRLICLQRGLDTGQQMRTQVPHARKPIAAGEPRPDQHGRGGSKDLLNFDE